jgi:predicted nuclease of restriction endonuclease-like (RecB) superfamily
LKQNQSRNGPGERSLAISLLFLTMKKGTATSKVSANWETLYKNIRAILDKARSESFRAVNFAMVQAYWNVGRIIVQEEQKGKRRADYGRELLKEISLQLTSDYGNGFTVTNLRYMRQFYTSFPIHHALRDELTWTHYRLLLKVEQAAAREFYMNEAINSNWSTRELERQISSLLYERLALSTDKEGLLQLAKKGHVVRQPDDLVKDPYVLEFLGLEKHERVVEKKLEQALIDHLQQFFLELGKGFSFVSRQQRITLDGDHFYIDLVFYNRLTKSFVLIDLKVGKLTHQDIGQMQMYVNYYERTQMIEGENPPIGIILCAQKNQAVVRFTLPEDQKQIFVSKYVPYIPTEKELKAEIMREKQMIETEMKLRGDEHE